MPAESRTQLLLTVAGLAAWLVVGIETFFSGSRWDAAGRMVGIGGFALFGLLLAVSLARFPSWQGRPEGWALLLVQAGLASLLSTDLLFLVAVQAALLLAPRAAGAFLVGQMALTLGLGWALWRTGQFVPAEGLTALSKPAAAVLTLIGVLAWQGLAFASGALAAAESRHRRELARVNAELRATQGLLADSSRLAERAEIARELHDSVGHHLAALAVNLDLAGRLVEGRAAEPVRQAHTVSRLLLGEVREVVSALRRDRALDLRQAFATLAAGVPAPPEVRLELPETLEVSDAARAHALFRTVQEAVTNAVRHAAATRVSIAVRETAAGLELTVRDDGRGTAAVVPGHGLAGMRERLEAAGGRLEITSRPAAGFTVTAHLPAPAEAV